MSRKTIDEVKFSVPIRTLFEQYGLHVTQSGFVNCPFHKDKHASLKLYDGTNSWFCFSCSRGGDIINFVMMMDNLNYKDAVRKISGELPVIPRRLSLPEDSIKNEFQKLLDERNYWNAIKEKETPIYNDSIINISELYATAVKKIPVIEARMDELLAKPNERTKGKEL